MTHTAHHSSAASPIFARFDGGPLSTRTSVATAACGSCITTSGGGAATAAGFASQEGGSPAPLSAATATAGVAAATAGCGGTGFGGDLSGGAFPSCAMPSRSRGGPSTACRMSSSVSLSNRNCSSSRTAANSTCRVAQRSRLLPLARAGLKPQQAATKHHNTGIHPWTSSIERTPGTQKEPCPCITRNGASLLLENTAGTAQRYA